MAKRKICVVTGTRAEYGLLYWLMKEIDADPDLTLLLFVTGTHLSSQFGYTVNAIEEDGFAIAPDRPGHGVEFDWEAMKPHIIS